MSPKNKIHSRLLFVLKEFLKKNPEQSKNMKPEGLIERFPWKQTRFPPTGNGISSLSERSEKGKTGITPEMTLIFKRKSPTTDSF
jgi:hypothetical protein